LGGVVVNVAEFIRSLGYPATAHHPRSFVGQPPTILHTAAALEAGLGEQGKHGLLINEKFGPRVRVATVTTDLELPQDKKKSIGVDKFCENCQLCLDACEGDAIPNEKRKVRGCVKYTIDPYKCLPHFAEYDGCNLCVSKCAFNKHPDELKEFIKILGKK
jgi:epoxyqueuosine reductase QueG